MMTAEGGALGFRNFYKGLTGKNTMPDAWDLNSGLYKRIDENYYIVKYFFVNSDYIEIINKEDSLETLILDSVTRNEIPLLREVKEKLDRIGITSERIFVQVQQVMDPGSFDPVALITVCLDKRFLAKNELAMIKIMNLGHNND